MKSILSLLRVNVFREEKKNWKIKTLLFIDDDDLHSLLLVT